MWSGRVALSFDTRQKRMRWNSILWREIASWWLVLVIVAASMGVVNVRIIWVCLIFREHVY
jgi:hypothetical protein